MITDHNGDTLWGIPAIRALAADLARTRTDLEHAAAAARDAQGLRPAARDAGIPPSTLARRAARGVPAKSPEGVALAALVGRSHEQTRALWAEIRDALDNGVPVAEVARAARLSRSTVDRWARVRP